MTWLFKLKSIRQLCMEIAELREEVAYWKAKYQVTEQERYILEAMLVSVRKGYQA